MNKKSPSKEGVKPFNFFVFCTILFKYDILQCHIMQKGQVGVIIVMIALIGSALGGFVLNAQDVPYCNTNMTYITDVAGAFSGDTGDIEVDYNPPENLTGYTVFNPTSTTQTTNVIHGINYKNTGANQYYMDTDDGNATQDTLSFVNNKPNTSSGTGTATMTFGSTEKTLTINAEYGVDTTEVKTQINTNSITHTRVVGVNVGDIIREYGVTDVSRIILNADNSINGYPGFIANVGVDISMQDAGTHRYVQALVTYDDINTSITVNPRTGVTVMGGQAYPTNEVMFVWGESDVTTASINMIIGSTGDVVYLDPTGGVQPTSVHQTVTTVITTTSYADRVNVRVNAPTPLSVGSIAAQAANGNISFELESETLGVNYSIINSETEQLVYLNNVLYAPYQNTGDNIGFIITWDDDTQNRLEVKFYEGSAIRRVIEITPGVFPTPQAVCKSVTATISDYGGRAQSENVTATITNETASKSTALQGNGTRTMSMLESISHTETISMDYTTTYWTNIGKTSDTSQYSGNTKLSMLFKKPSETDTDTFIVHLKTLTDTYIPISVTIKYDSAWYVNGTTYGNWPAVMLHFVVSEGKIVLSVQPVASFVNFTDYTLMDRVYATDTYDSITNAKSIQYMEFQNTGTKYMYHEIVATTVLLEGGGLYIQNGVFSPATSFPHDTMSSFRVTAAAHAGESMTIRPTAGLPITLTVNSDGTAWLINSTEIKFADVWIYYVGNEAETTTIGNVTYPGALYLDGEVYAKGHLYLKPGSGNMIDLGTSTNAWTVTMDGTWAMATAYYTGNNQADIRTEFTDIGTWQWDSSQFILVFIGLLVIGLIITLFKFESTWLDWAIVICAGVISFIILG